MNQTNTRRNTNRSVIAAMSFVVLLGATGCTDKRHDCVWLANCANAGGVAAAGSAGAAVAFTTAGAAGLPCNGTCSGSTPHCKNLSQAQVCVQCTADEHCTKQAPGTLTRYCSKLNSCVECITNDHCTSAGKPYCTDAGICVECVGNEGCSSDLSSRCDLGTHTCASCLEDADCGHISDKTRCLQDGTGPSSRCVQCTLDHEEACNSGSNACNPATHTCTSTPKGSLGTCRSCVADSQCAGGNLPSPTARCVPMALGKSRILHGSYCLQVVGNNSCLSPYAVPISTGSLSGAAPELYCGVNQDNTTCEAIIDMLNAKSCQSDADCGAAPDGNSQGVGGQGGAGATPGQAGAVQGVAGLASRDRGGLCRAISVLANAPLKCTIPCTYADQCLSPYVCESPSVPYCHPQ